MLKVSPANRTKLLRGVERVHGGVLGKPLANDEALAGAPVPTVEVLQFCREIQAE